MHIRYTLLAIPFLAMAAFGQDSVDTRTSTGTFSGTALFSEPPARQIRPVTGAPYSAEETFTLVQTLADGTHITKLNTTRKMYRDSEGRTRIERAIVNNRIAQRVSAEVPVIVEITDPVEHVQYTLDPVNKVAHKQTLTAGPNPNRPTLTRRSIPRVPGGIATAGPVAAPAPGQASSENKTTTTHEKLGTQTIEGVEAEGTRFTTVSPAAPITTTNHLQL